MVAAGIIVGRFILFHMFCEILGKAYFGGLPRVWPVHVWWLSVCCMLQCEGHAQAGVVVFPRCAWILCHWLQLGPCASIYRGSVVLCQFMSCKLRGMCVRAVGSSDICLQFQRAALCPQAHSGAAWDVVVVAACSR